MSSKNIKNKFITKNDPSQNCYNISQDKAESINIENKLQFNKYKDNKELNKVNFYYTTSHTGPGRGFGNLEVSNDMHFGNSSRIDTKQYKEMREGDQLFDYQFQYLDRNFQNPNNIVMPTPRGGNSTREKTQLFINPQSKIEFTY